jgi:hypothetical protein
VLEYYIINKIICQYKKQKKFLFFCKKMIS